MQYLTIVDQHGRNIPASMIHAGGYEGSSTGRRLASWGLAGYGPNSALQNSLSALRSRQRELVRNHPLAGGGVDTLIANMIGGGITPRWLIDDRQQKERIQQLWSDSVPEMDYDGVCDFYGLQDLVARSMCNGGEALVLVRYRSPYSSELTVPLQVQIIEADHLDENHNGIAPNGNRIRMGIEFDNQGHRAAYWLWRRHPGENFDVLTGPDNRRVRLPADRLLHVYRPLRAGQLRGLPWFASIILKLHEIDQCVDAELVRRKTTAMFGGFIKRDLPMDGAFAGGRLLGRAADSDQTVIELEPGTFPELPPGTDVKFAQPTDVSGNYVAWMQQQLRDIARGMGITYEQLTGDLTGVNYSSIRAGLLEFRRLVTQLQARTIIYQFCRPVARMWLDTAVLTGALDIPDYFQNRRRYQRIKWMPDGWDWVDPVKDLKADIMEIRAGLTSRTRKIAQRQGADAEDIDREIAADNQRADSLGLVLDSDPRRTAASGKINDSEDER